MARDDYFRMLYEILKKLYLAKKQGQPVDLLQISADSLGIPQGYRDEILSDALYKGLVSGFTVKSDINGTVVMGLERIKITYDGIEYLKENSNMRKVVEYLKTIGEFIPTL